MVRLVATKVEISRSDGRTEGGKKKGLQRFSEEHAEVEFQLSEPTGRRGHSASLTVLRHMLEKKMEDPRFAKAVGKVLDKQHLK